MRTQRLILLGLASATLAGCAQPPKPQGQPRAPSEFENETMAECRRQVQQKMYTTMIEVCEAAIKSVETQEAPTLLARASVIGAHLAARSVEGVQAQLDAALQAKPPMNESSLANLYRRLGAAYVSQKSYEQAIAPLNKALSFRPDAMKPRERVEATYQLTTALLATHRYADTIRAITQNPYPADFKASPRLPLMWVRLSEGWRGLIMDAEANNKTPDPAWFKSRRAALEAALANGDALAVHPGDHPDYRCILPVVWSLPGISDYGWGKSMATIQIRPDGWIRQASVTVPDPQKPGLDRTVLAMAQRIQCEPTGQREDVTFKLPIHLPPPVIPGK